MSRARSLRVYLITLVVFVVSSLSASGVFGNSTAPSTNPAPPRPPVDSAAPSVAAPDFAPLSLPPLKAVLLVGPIDGNNGSWTLQEIDNMELAATVLQNNGVEVHRFYPGDGHTFAEIEAAADGAHFLLYRGHGVYVANTSPLEVGGFMLSSGYYSPDRIRSNLHLAPNAVVMLYGCFTAGTSSSDDGDIGIVEARRRVAMYSDPFFDIDAAGYYANWFGDAFQYFLQYLFAGQTLGQAYESFYDFNATTVDRTTHPDHPEMVRWIDKDNWDFWKYNNAFVGLPNVTLEGLFANPELGGIPSALSFDAEVGNSITFLPASRTVTPLNVGDDQTLTWSLSTSGAWFDVNRTTGSTPQSFTITPESGSFPTDRPGTYAGEVTVTVTAPDGTDNAVQTIDLTLEVLVPELGGLPGRIDFVYSIASDEFLIPSYTITPQNVGTTADLAWEVTTDSDWLDIDSRRGRTPGSFTLTASGFDPSTAATYNGEMIVTATSDASVYRSPQTIPISLRVIDQAFSYSYLPLTMRNR
jgi:hypothetical protein